MSRKLSAALGILILAAVIHHFIRSTPSGIRPFAKIKNISALELEDFQSGDKIRLVKRAGEWEIITSTNFPADTRRARTLASEAGNLIFESVMSLSSEKRFENGLSSSSAIRITLSGKKSVSVLIGKQAFGRNHFYAGFENDSKSYLAGGLRRDRLMTEAGYYRKRRIASVREEDVSVLGVKGGEKVLSFSRGESGWDSQIESPKDFYDFASACLNMSASDFYDNDFVSSHRIEITKNDGNVAVWELARASGGGFCARVPGENGSYIVPTAKAENIVRFFKKNAAK